MVLINKILLLFVIFLSTQCGQLSHDINRNIASDGVIDLVFDIDWTIVSELKEPAQNISSENVVTVNGIKYRINDWAIEMITELSKRPNVRISFFSGGGEDRNIKLLSKLRLMNQSGRSFKDISYKIKSFDDLYEVPEEMVNGNRFTDRYRKNLLKINEDLSNVLLIDDNYRFAVNQSQRPNILWLGPTYIHYETLKNLPALPVDPEIEMFIPKTSDQWFVARNKLLFIWGIIDDVLSKGNQGFLKEVQAASNSLGLESGNISEELLRNYNEKYWKLNNIGFRKGRVSQGDQCGQLIRTFF